MKPQFEFIAERALARHCPELINRGPDLAALEPVLAKVGDRLARRLAGALAPLLGGEAPMVQCSPPRDGAMATLREAATALLAAHSLFAVGPSRAPLLVTIAADAVLKIVDRAFGGKGTAPRPLPEVFPSAAEMMIARLETMVAGQISSTLDAVSDGDPAMAGPRHITPHRRDSSLGQLAPFGEDETLLILTLDVQEVGEAAWSITLALPKTALPALFGMAGACSAAGSRRATRGSTDAPFADVPLRLSALIVDMAVPFASIAALVPGHIMPVTVARTIPLRVDDHIIAHGTIGAVDDSVAIQITSAFSH